MEIQVNIDHAILWEFKQRNNAMARVKKKIWSVYGEGVINDKAVRNLFVKFRSGEFNDNILKAILEQNPRNQQE